MVSFYIIACEVGYIDKSHATGVIGEQQEVAGEDQSRFFQCILFQVLYFLDHLFFHGPFLCLFDAGVYTFEEVGAFFYQPVDECLVLIARKLRM